MVPKLFSSGKSFAKLGAYLLHDAEKAKSSERVKWTHTLNLANDHPAAAIDEMLWTYRAADDLKRAAGVRIGGKPLKTPVRHFSLNWHPSEKPTKEHMVETVQDFVKHMGWQEHQALIVCHDDKDHTHLHVMINSVHPQTGRALDAGFERRRAQTWAQTYEREHGVFCEERSKPVAEREPSPTRPMHEAMKEAGKKFDHIEQRRQAKQLDFFTRHDSESMNAKEWDALKAHQRAQREAYFATGKDAFKAVRDEVYRAVRQEYRGQWRALYAAKRSGGDPKELAAMKVALVAAQKKALDERRDAACDVLRERRDKEYEALLKQQQVDRKELTQQQERGQRTHRMFDVIYPAPQPIEVIRDVRTPGERIWQHHTLGPARDEIEHQLRRGAEIAVDPAREDARRKPASIARNLAPAALPAREEPARPTERTRPAPEMTEARVEAQRAERAREVTDQAQARGVEGDAVVRASWNRHRRYRGGRD